MARMVPFPMLGTPSTAERRLYEGFLEQLDQTYVVYHSVRWVLSGRDGPQEGEADFVIAHPEDGILVLEAKGGGLTYEPATGKWRQTGRGGGHILDKDPFDQARSEMHSLVEILRGQTGWEEWMPSYGYGVAFPDTHYERAVHPAALPEFAIDRGDLDTLEARVREIQRYWARAGRKFGERGMDALAQALGFRVELRVPLKLEFDEEERQIVELTEEQSWVRAWIMNRHRAAVLGEAGSGKTLLAVRLAQDLAAAGKRTLLTCFNEPLAAHLRAWVGDTQGLEVRHFHDLCRHAATEAGIAVPDVDPADERTYYEETLPELLADAAAEVGPGFDAMVVDEAQDFRDWWWPSLLALHRDPDEGALYLFADNNQNLYGGKLPLGKEAELPLPGNLRNTREIHGFISVFYADGDGTHARGPKGRPVEVLDYSDTAGLVRLLEVVLRNLVDEEKVPLEDIVVLTPARPSKSPLRQLGHAGPFEFSERVETGKVLVSTVHRFKGLERPVVILAEIGDRHRDGYEQYLYVGGSRARSHLIVLAQEEVAARIREEARVAHP